jgi:sodium-dependent dicarboxylate transporter 2/3/5
MFKKIGLITAPLLFLLILFLPNTITSLSPEAQKVVAVAVWMVIWWISEAVSLAVTALLPIALFPLLGVMDSKETTAPYSSPIIFLFLGGFVIALALERWNLHKRIALSIVQLTGTNANGIILGFMLATAFLSMWISNTATTVMMMPIALSIIHLLTSNSKNDKNARYFTLAMLLGIAYSANIGGIATLIGTPPNVVFVGIMKENYQLDIDFFMWFKIGFPISIILLTCTYFLLVKVFYPNHLGSFETAKVVLQEELDKLGKMTKGEVKVLIVFVLTALCWILRSSINHLFEEVQLTDAGIAIVATISLFIIPVDWKKDIFILEWKDTKELPWGILLLFGGGLTLAKALEKTGIIQLIGDQIANTSTLELSLTISLLIAVMLFMTELMSNVALTTIFIPVVAGIAISLGISPLRIAIPVTIAASCAFMLPMATPPNAIVFASGEIKVAQMAKIGIFINIIAVILLSIFANLFLGNMLN